MKNSNRITPEEIDIFEVEEQIGAESQKVYDSYIRGFCDEKRKTLFNAFRDLPLTAENELMEVKRMLYAIDTLEADIITKIETGKMATKSLEDIREVH